MAPLPRNPGANKQFGVRMTRAASAVADRLSRIGLGRLTRQARRLLARLTGDKLTVQAHGVTITGSFSNHYQYLLQLPDGGPHPYQLELFIDRVRPGTTVADVGAHIGVYTTLAATAVGASGHVIAVEPDARNAELLRQNLAANDVAERVEIVEAAASDANGTVRFFLDQADATGTMGSLWKDPLATSRPVEMPAVRLDDALAAHQPDLVKFDVQGAELAALRGMEKTLKRSVPETIFVELNGAALERAGSSGAELVATLHGFGLTVWLIDEGERRLVAVDDDVPGTLATKNLLCPRA